MSPAIQKAGEVSTSSAAIGGGGGRSSNCGRRKSARASSTGQDLLDVVIKHLNLLETSYFGLRYLAASTAPNNEQINGKIDQVWLDVDKNAIKQLRHVQPMTVYFGVKYYAHDPCKLAEEITRYQFFLQCKQDILNSRLPISFELAVELFALAVQSELGDYDPNRHQPGYVSEFQFLPQQSVELERRVAQWHRQLTGQVPATAELNFLERVKWLDLYGCELHPIQYEEDNSEEYALGLNPSGVLVLRNKLRVAHYLWPRIVKTKSQGRCFLMDVIEQQQQSGGQQTAKCPSAGNRNRFGFRLADKDASRRLRAAVEEHKGFHYLIHNSASLNQLAHRQHQHQQQQQQLKLSQRFRNSIRSAINGGSLHHHHQLHHPQQHQHQRQQQILRSSVKSLGNHQPMMQQQQHYPIDSRPPPTVVRMPSRRYSNRSMRQVPTVALNGANGNGLPAQPHTMSDGLRQEALMALNHQFHHHQHQQQHQMNQLIMGKSHTLKPTSSAKSELMLSSRNESKKYYQQQQQLMLMMQAAGHPPPEVAILPPGRHIIQPSIYKSSSVVNGMNQLGKSSAETPGMQFYSRPSANCGFVSQRGHESPRSTKSAMGPSAALKLASKKLAKQHHQLFYQDVANHPGDAQPLLAAAYDLNQNNLTHLYSGSSTGAHDYYSLHHPTSGYHHSANPSPRSVRSARLATRHKSKSTNENLNLLHQPLPLNGNKYSGANQYQLQPMLLATAVHPPPGYYATNGQQQQPKGNRPLNSDNESELSKLSKRSQQLKNKKRATFALDHDQATLLLQDTHYAGQQPNKKGAPSDDDDYFCSHSDCSSANGDDGQPRRPAGAGQQQHHRRNRRLSGGSGQQQMNQKQADQQQQTDQKEWNAIRKRHNDFLLNGSFGAGQQQQQTEHMDANNNNRDKANNSNNNQVVKNIANKQATPILLSMSYDQTNANNKAIQLLNLQRQQLNSQSSASSDAGIKSQSSSLADSNPSSVASSPKAPNQGQQQQQQSISGGKPMSGAGKTTDSTASSGYYAGSNSTGSASVDSDTGQMTLDSSPSTATKSSPHQRQQFGDWPQHQHQQQEPMGTRAKIALGSYPSRLNAAVAASVVGQPRDHNKANNHQHLAQVGSPPPPPPPNGQQTRSGKQQFYLGEPNNNSENEQPSSVDIDTRSHWSPLNQIQQHAPSSLKYVSFDV